MSHKVTYAIFVFLLLVIMALFFFLSPSYEKAFEAKYYYMNGKYKQAYSLALKASELDTYNKMATTIVSQSQRAIKFVDFIEEAQSYMYKIKGMDTQDGVNTSDAAKIKIMCQIILEKYEKLSATVVTNKKLVEEAKQYKLEFEKLYEQISKTI